MANKRTLKKRIHQVCGEAAVDVLIALPSDKSHPIVFKIAELQTRTLSNITFSFDHAGADFANRAEYNKARAAYNRKAFAKLNADFRDGLRAIVAELNAVAKTVPAE